MPVFPYSQVKNNITFGELIDAKLVSRALHSIFVVTRLHFLRLHSCPELQHGVCVVSCRTFSIADQLGVLSCGLVAAAMEEKCVENHCMGSSVSSFPAARSFDLLVP